MAHTREKSQPIDIPGSKRSDPQSAPARLGGLEGDDVMSLCSFHGSFFVGSVGEEERCLTRKKLLAKAKGHINSVEKKDDDVVDHRDEMQKGVFNCP